MKVELFPFQKKAVYELRTRTAAALGMYQNTHIPQVISLQAPTGAGKTIIMAALIEDIYFGTENYADQPEAIFVWLSDSPALNEQSKQKIDLKADRIKFGQCVVIEDDSFDMEELQDGHIYFLNTQKLGKAGNLGKHSDNRQYTIWETLENTAKKTQTDCILSLMRRIGECRGQRQEQQHQLCKDLSKEVLRINFLQYH